MERRALENIERSIVQDLNKIDPFDKTTFNDLESLKEGLTLASDFFCKLLNNQVNHMKSENRKIKMFYRTDYHRTLSYQLLRGPISKSIFALTPLRDIDELDKTTTKLDNMSYRFSALSGYSIEKINDLMKAKKENNPSLFDKIKKEMREFILDFMAKYGDEMSKP